MPQFYVTGNHEAIIPPQDFDRVQAELARRKTIGRGYSGNSVFASRIICGDCGGYYGQKVWHSNDPYRKIIWRCNRKYGRGEKCKTPTLDEETIKALFLKAYNLLMANREAVAEDCKTVATMLADTATLDRKIQAAKKEMDDVIALSSAYIHSHNADGEHMEEFEQQTAAYDEQYQKIGAKLNRLQSEKQERLFRSKAIMRFIDDMLERPLILEKWEDQPWNLLVNQAVVSENGSVTFTFRGENRITVRTE